jgi:geranylgeranyl pyrophosphate synthase
MDGILGQPGATSADCDTVRMIFAETGSRRYAEEIAQVYAAEATAALGDNPEPFLIDLARFAVNRTS